MDWSPDRWLAPNYVETPDVVADIAQFIDGRVTAEVYDSMEANTRRKLTVLAERLEFVDHLSTVSAFIMNRNRASKSSTPLAGGKLIVTATYSATIDGHDFAGFHHDVDALIVYLLLTCVDTVKGHFSHVSVFDWLKERLSPGEEADWDKLSYEYQQDYGLSRRFREAFTQDCSEPLREALAEGFAVVKIAGQAVKPESAAAWEKRSVQDRVKRIAEELYSIRSSFTHMSSRSFSPAVPVRHALDADKSVLIQRVGGRPLWEILQAIVRDVAGKLLVDGGQGQPVHAADG